MPNDGVLEIGVKYIQGSSLRKLQEELGFGENFPSRDTKSFKRSMVEFRLAFEASNGALRYLYPNSPEARACAKAFCSEDNRGKKLWPSNNHYYPTTIPHWPRDEEQIIKSLAHYFTLQVYHLYQEKHRRRQNNGKNNSAKATKVPSVKRGPALKQNGLVNPANSQNFSRESTQVTNPAVPSNLKSNHVGNTSKYTVLTRGPYCHISPTFRRLDFEKKCLAEIKSLDPRVSSRPEQHTLSRKWLSVPRAEWPAGSFKDRKLKRLILAKDYYNGDNESDMLDLGRILRKRTEIEEISPVERLREFQSRLVQRVKYHVVRFRELGFLKQEDSQHLRKDKTFDEVWKKRKSYWKPKDDAATQMAGDSRAPGASLDSVESVQGAMIPVRRDPETTIATSIQAPPANPANFASPVATPTNKSIARLEFPTSAPPEASDTSSHVPATNLSRRNTMDPDFGSSREKQRRPNRTAKPVSNVSFEHLTQRSPRLFKTSQASQLSAAPPLSVTRFRFQDDEIEQGLIKSGVAIDVDLYSADEHVHMVEKTATRKDQEVDVRMTTNEPPAPAISAQVQLASSLSSGIAHQFSAKERQSLPSIGSIVEPAGTQLQLDTPMATDNTIAVVMRKRKSSEVHTPRERPFTPEDRDWPIERFGRGDRALSPSLEALAVLSPSGLTSNVVVNGLLRPSIAAAEATALQQPQAVKRTTESPPSNAAVLYDFQHPMPSKQAEEIPRHKTPSQSTLSSRRQSESSPPIPKQRLMLIVHKANGELIFDDNNTGMSYWQLQTLSVQDFFFLFAEKSGASPQDIDSLRFNFMFARENDTSVGKGDEDGWRKLKLKTEVLFQLRSEKEAQRADWPVVIEAEYGRNLG